MCEGNKRYNIYLNTTGTKDDISFDLKEMFRYINGGEKAIGMKTKSEFVRTLDKYVQEFNANDTWRQGYMKFELMMRDNYKNGRAEGLAEGRAQAEAQIVKNMYSKQISLETIADCTQLSLAEVQKIISTK